MSCVVVCSSLNVVMRAQFKKLLNRELSQFAESSKAGTQISEYICSTFLGQHIKLSCVIY